MKTSLLLVFLILWSSLSPIAALCNSSRLACGDDFSLVLHNDKTVWSWGNNYMNRFWGSGSGKLGDGTTENQPWPVQVLGLKDIKGVFAGRANSLGIQADSRTWAWGANGYGLLGDGTKHHRSRPAQIPLSNIKTASCGPTHTVAVVDDGTVWSWGSNSSGQLGDGTNAERLHPVQVVGLSNVIQVAAGQSSSLAVKSDGTVWAWGYDDIIPHPNSNMGHSLIPVQATGLSDIRSIAVEESHTTALKRDGTVWTWGENYYGQLGNGSTETRFTPEQVPGLHDIQAIDTGRDYSVALGKDGSVWSWGYNEHGQLGDGSTKNRLEPVRVTELNNVEAISVGQNHALAVKQDGSVWTWGRNDSGKLGDGTIIDRPKPVRVRDFSGKQFQLTGSSEQICRINREDVRAFKTVSELEGLSKSSYHSRTGEATTLPIPSNRDGTLYVVLFVYHTSARPGSNQIMLPHLIIVMDPKTGKVMQDMPWNLKPLSVSTSSGPLPAPTMEKMSGQEHLSLLERIEKISPYIWAIYDREEKRKPSLFEKRLLKEYRTIFQRISRKPLLPYFKAAAPDFWTWLTEQTSS